jgi:hypothetical protein
MKADTVIDRRMSVLKLAVRMNEEKGLDAVLEAYDALWGRLTTGEGLGITSEEFATSQVERFFSACVEVTNSDAHKVQHKVLFSAFKEWCASEGEHAIGMRKFGGIVASLVDKHISCVTWYMGIRLKETPDA